MPFLRSVEIQAAEGDLGREHPFDVLAIASMATHSPLLIAHPDATIYEFHADGPTPTTWSQIDTVHITTDFLNDPTGFLAELFADDDHW